MTTPAAAPTPTKVSSSTDFWTALGLGVAAAVAGTSAYHGYKRNGDSPGWGLLWGVFGFTMPPAAVIGSLAQGYAEPSDTERLKRLEHILNRPELVGVPSR